MTGASLKRSISVEEKSSIGDRNYKALIFLGQGCPEVSELMDVGFKRSQIIGLDYGGSSAPSYSSLHNVEEARRQGILAFHQPFASWWRHSGLAFKYSYVHLDFCGLATEERLRQTLLPVDRLVPNGRLRVTFCGSTPRNHSASARLLLPSVQAWIRAATVGRLIPVHTYVYKGARGYPYWSLLYDRI